MCTAYYQFFNTCAPIFQFFDGFQFFDDSSPILRRFFSNSSTILRRFFDDSSTILRRFFSIFHIAKPFPLLPLPIPGRKPEKGNKKPCWQAYILPGKIRKTAKPLTDCPFLPYKTPFPLLLTTKQTSFCFFSFRDSIKKSSFCLVNLSLRGYF